MSWKHLTPFLVLALVAGATAQDQPLAFVHGTVYDGTGQNPLSDGVVVVRGGRIHAIGPHDKTAVPKGVKVIDCRGKFLTPGLIDTHVHYSQTGWADGRPDATDVRSSHPYETAMAENATQPERFHRAFLACGVTAVFDVGGYPWTRRLGAGTENSPLAPHVAATGALITTWEPTILGLPDQKQFVLMEDEKTARYAVRSHAAAGSDAIKIWYIVRRGTSAADSAPLVMAVGDEARKVGLPLVVHATTLATAKVAVAAGAHLLVHSVGDRPVDDEFVAAIVKAGTSYCPTLTVRAGYAQLYGRKPSQEVLDQLQYVHPSVQERIHATTQIKGGRRSSPRIVEAYAKRLKLQGDIMAKNLRRLHEAGVPVVMGTDAGNPLTLHGPSVFPEMEAMQAAGLTPREVVTASTRDAARAMGRGKDLGLLAKGRIADLLVLDRDPGADIKNMRSITHVCRAGVLHERNELIPK